MCHLKRLLRRSMKFSLYFNLQCHKKITMPCIFFFFFPITHTVKKRSHHPREVSLKSWAKEGLCRNKDVGGNLKRKRARLYQ